LARERRNVKYAFAVGTQPKARFWEAEEAQEALGVSRRTNLHKFTTRVPVPLVVTF